MKAELVVKIWVAVLFACVLGLLGSLIPWPASLRGTWSAGDWAAWVQAVGSVSAIAAGALAIRWQVAQESRRESVRELRMSLQELTEIQDLLEAALAHALADRESCRGLGDFRNRMFDSRAHAESSALTWTFGNAHLDRVHSMRVRLAFARAKDAFALAGVEYQTIKGDVMRGAVTIVEHKLPRFDVPLKLLKGAIQELDDEATELRARLTAELAI